MTPIIFKMRFTDLRTNWRSTPQRNAKHVQYIGKREHALIAEKDESHVKYIGDRFHNTWCVIYRYKNALGQRKQGQKCRFKTRREAVAWEHEQMNKHEIKLDMILGSFFEIYANDMKNRIRENTWKTTWKTKESIYEKKILSFFKDRRMNDIQVKDIIAWQNAMMDFTDTKGRHYSPVYLKTLHNQLSAVFNHAVKYYELPSNPAAKAGAMGKRKGKEMLFWTQDEYKLFAEQIMNKPVSYYAFEMPIGAVCARANYWHSQSLISIS